MGNTHDRLDALQPHFLALSAFDRVHFVRGVRNDRLVKKVRPREVKAQKRVAAAKIEKLAQVLKAVRSEWLPQLLQESD